MFARPPVVARPPAVVTMPRTPARAAAGAVPASPRSIDAATASPPALWLTELLRGLQAHLQHATRGSSGQQQPPALIERDLEFEELRGVAPQWAEAVEDLQAKCGGAPTIGMHALLLWVAQQPLELCLDLLGCAVRAAHAVGAAEAVPAYASAASAVSPRAAAAPAAAPAFQPPVAHRHSWILLSALFDSLPRSSRWLALAAAGVSAPGSRSPRVRLEVLLAGMKEWWGCDPKHAPILLLDMAEAKGELSALEVWIWWSTWGAFEYRRRCGLKQSSGTHGAFLYLYHWQYRLMHEQAQSQVAVALSPTPASTAQQPLSCITLLQFMKVFAYFHPGQLTLQKVAESAYLKRLSQGQSAGSGAAAPVSPMKGMTWSEVIALLLSSAMPENWRKSILYRGPPASPAAASSSASHPVPPSPTHASTSSGLVSPLDGIDWLRRFQEDEAAYSKTLLAQAASTHEKLKPFLTAGSSSSSSAATASDSASPQQQSLSFDSFIADLLADEPIVEPQLSVARLLRVMHTLRFIPHFFLQLQAAGSGPGSELKCTLREFTASFLRAIERREQEREERAAALAAGGTATPTSASSSARKLGTPRSSTGKKHHARSITSPDAGSKARGSAAATLTRGGGGVTIAAAASSTTNGFATPRSRIVSPAASNGRARSSSRKRITASVATPTRSNAAAQPHPDLASLRHQTALLKQAVAADQASSLHSQQHSGEVSYRSAAGTENGAAEDDAEEQQFESSQRASAQSSRAQSIHFTGEEFGQASSEAAAAARTGSTSPDRESQPLTPRSASGSVASAASSRRSPRGSSPRRHYNGSEPVTAPGSARGAAPPLPVQLSPTPPLRLIPYEAVDGGYEGEQAPPPVRANSTQFPSAAFAQPVAARSGSPSRRRGRSRSRSPSRASGGSGQLNDDSIAWALEELAKKAAAARIAGPWVAREGSKLLAPSRAALAISEGLGPGHYDVPLSSFRGGPAPLLRGKPSLGTEPVKSFIPGPGAYNPPSLTFSAPATLIRGKPKPSVTITGTSGSPGVGMAAIYAAQLAATQAQGLSASMPMPHSSHQSYRREQSPAAHRRIESNASQQSNYSSVSHSRESPRVRSRAVEYSAATNAAAADTTVSAAPSSFDSAPPSPPPPAAAAAAAPAASSDADQQADPSQQQQAQPQQPRREPERTRGRSRVRGGSSLGSIELALADPSPAAAAVTITAASAATAAPTDASDDAPAAAQSAEPEMW